MAERGMGEVFLQAQAAARIELRREQLADIAAARRSVELDDDRDDVRKNWEELGDDDVELDGDEEVGRGEDQDDDFVLEDDGDLEQDGVSSRGRGEVAAAVMSKQRERQAVSSTLSSSSSASCSSAQFKPAARARAADGPLACAHVPPSPCRPCAQDMSDDETDSDGSTHSEVWSWLPRDFKLSGGGSSCSSSSSESPCSSSSSSEASEEPRDLGAMPALVDLSSMQREKSVFDGRRRRVRPVCEPPWFGEHTGRGDDDARAAYEMRRASESVIEAAARESDCGCALHEVGCYAAVVARAMMVIGGLARLVGLRSAKLGRTVHREELAGSIHTPDGHVGPGRAFDYKVNDVYVCRSAYRFFHAIPESSMRGLEASAFSGSIVSKSAQRKMVAGAIGCTHVQSSRSSKTEHADRWIEDFIDVGAEEQPNKPDVQDSDVATLRQAPRHIDKAPVICHACFAHFDCGTGEPCMGLCMYSSYREETAKEFGKANRPAGPSLFRKRTKYLFKHHHVSARRNKGADHAVALSLLVHSPSCTLPAYRRLFRLSHMRRQHSNYLPTG